MILQMAYRNIIGHKRRSILTGMALTVGYILMSISISISNGMYDNVIDIFTRSRVGDVQIHKDNYLDDPSIYKSLKEGGHLLDIISNNKLVISYAPRIYSGALSFFNKKSTGTQMIGIDPLLENKTTSIKKRLIAGNYFKGLDSYQAIITSNMAQILKINLKEKLVVITQGADGSIANDLFEIVGIIPDENAQTIYLPLKVMQEFLSMPGKIHEYAIIGNRASEATNISNSLKLQIKQKIQDSNTINVSPWYVVEKDFYSAMTMDKNGTYFSLFIIMLIVIISVLNAILMSILERTKEFGILKAIGTRPIQIFKIILIEVLLLSFFSLILGLIISLVCNYLFMIYGYEYDIPISFAGMTFTSIKGTINLSCFLIPAIVVFFSAIIISIIPGLRAANIVPVKALKTM